jgi:hypothetical protein
MPATLTPDDVARPVEAEAFRVNLDLLSPAQLRDILDTYEALLRVMNHCNNELILKLCRSKGLTAQHGALLNSWSSVLNDLHKGFDQEVARIVTRDFPETGAVQ